MAGFQFVHMQTFSRKPLKSGTGTGFVFSEALRRPGSCDHVEVPGEPVVVYGQSVEVIEARHDAMAAVAILTDAKGKARKVRQDQHTLMTVVASHPATPAQVREDPAAAAAVARWQELTIDWLQRQHGDRLVSVVRHDDESHVHMHAYVLPDDPAMKARPLHPGVHAKEAAVSAAVLEGLDSKAANRRGDQAYRQAMRSWQDTYWHDVGLACGLARLGPGRRRLSRAGWQAEQAQVERVASLSTVLSEVAKAEAVLEHAAPLLAEVAELKAVRDAAIAAAETAKLDADRIRADAKSSASSIIKKAKRQAAGIVSAARREVESMRGIGMAVGAALGGIFQAMLASSPTRVAEAVRADEREAAQVRESGFLASMKTLQSDCGRLIKERDEAYQLIREVAGERDSLRVQLYDKQPRLSVVDLSVTR